MKAKARQYKDLLWTFLRSQLLGYALKSITGPWGWFASKVLPVLVDNVLKPAYDKTIRKAAKYIRIKKNQRKVEDMNNDETVDDYLDSLNK